jgi:hypothetical protein
MKDEPASPILPRQKKSGDRRARPRISGPIASPHLKSHDRGQTRTDRRTNAEAILETLDPIHESLARAPASDASLGQPTHFDCTQKWTNPTPWLRSRAESSWHS